MARGNQRDKAREANAKKQAALAKGGSGMSKSQMQADKDKTRVLLMEKQKKSDEKKAADALLAAQTKK
ncbi:hypothetical protein SBOR_9350 [Sclerotinia borealis F-4128]|uniref:Small EDRK-rich factor-like N-terminal domain-containing protein n=1 Tax=Sclerotinia borealis (strain F-4128) TaxID=1432307 RepID=W9C5T0_SCLBF|nr:hypothetical protein SBOR_9350 [Sclerotinia borealis F-4128]